MKQRITLEQYAELPESQRDVILDLADHHRDDFLLAIGQMIAYLKEQQFVDIDRVCTFSMIFWSDLRTEWVVRFEDETGDGLVEFNADELCAGLWEGTKEALAKST
jgi:hypothetical protein